MPSACTKPGNKASTEVETPIKQVLTLVDKKVRNLEKRKGKLDGYREKAASGTKLNEDQRDAVSRYEAVVQTLEYSRELQKQFIAIQVEAEKLQKKQLKRDSHVRQQMEIRRINELLAVQNLLDSMGAEEVRADFVGGTKGAVKLTEDELNKLDELYKLISPTRDDENNYTEQLTTASEHIVSFLDGREKEVIGTTYKDLKAIVEKINTCGYFDNKADEEGVKEEAAVVEDQDDEDEVEAAAEIDEDDQETMSEQVVEDVAEVTQSLPPTQSQQPTQAPTLDFGLVGDNAAATASMLGQQQHNVLQQLPDAAATATEEPQTFFSTQPFPQPRPFNEIVSSVQGNFNFLQDSEIEQQAKAQAAAAAQQLDPAVVAAQMSHAAAATDAASALSFQTSSLLADSTSSQDQYSQDVDQSGGLQFTADSHQLQQASYQDEDQTIYAQSLMTQGLQNTAQQYVSEGNAPPGYPSDQNTYGHGASSGVAADNGPPQPIPMPGQYAPGAEQTAAAAAAEKNKKEFSMNPNADIFQSMYTGGGDQQQQAYSSQQASAASAADNKQAYPPTTNAWGNNDFQQPGYGGGQYRRGGDSRGNQGAGGYRGAGQARNGGGSGAGAGAGAGTGAANVSNGYRGGSNNSRAAPNSQPRGGRGGAYNAGGRGGMPQQQQQQQGGMRGSGGNSGGASYKGYPSRNDYQPEGGYQGFNQSTAGSGFMPASASSQGGPRGGPRGGNSRGGPRGGTDKFGANNRMQQPQ